MNITYPYTDKKGRIWIDEQHFKLKCGCIAFSDECGYHHVSFCKEHREMIDKARERHHCDVCGIDFEGEPGEHINAEHYDDIHSSESMTRFEERHISEVD